MKLKKKKKKINNKCQNKGIYIYIKSMGPRPVPHTQTKWPFGHLKHDGQMAIKRKK
jgi:hypothetical protein